MRQPFDPAIVLSLALFVLCACSSTRPTILELRGNPKGPAHYEFRQTVHRDTPLGPEFIGYGLLYFDNSELSRHHDMTWPRGGHVTFRLRATPIGGDRYAIAVLGPARSAGPGDDEILSAIATRDRYALTESSGHTELALRNVPTRSRNHPDLNFILGGTIRSTPATPSQFAGHLDDFRWDYNSRVNAGPAPPPFPPE